jgi:hypothetical protein
MSPQLSARQWAEATLQSSSPSQTVSWQTAEYNVLPAHFLEMRCLLSFSSFVSSHNQTCIFVRDSLSRQPNSVHRQRVAPHAVCCRLTRRSNLLSLPYREHPNLEFFSLQCSNFSVPFCSFLRGVVKALSCGIVSFWSFHTSFCGFWVSHEFLEFRERPGTDGVSKFVSEARPEKVELNFLFFGGVPSARFYLRSTLVVKIEKTQESTPSWGSQEVKGNWG